MKLKIGDNIKVVLGKDKGREGKIEKLYPKESSVLVTGINLYKKHVKGNQGGIKAGIYDIPRPLNIAKVALVCPNCKKLTRIKIVKEKNEINRFCRKCNKKIGKA